MPPTISGTPTNWVTPTSPPVPTRKMVRITNDYLRNPDMPNVDNWPLFLETLTNWSPFNGCCGRINKNGGLINDRVMDIDGCLQIGYPPQSHALLYEVKPYGMTMAGVKRGEMATYEHFLHSGGNSVIFIFTRTVNHNITCGHYTLYLEGRKEPIERDFSDVSEVVAAARYWYDSVVYPIDKANFLGRGYEHPLP
jgi:hypothetical protein